MKSVLGLAAVAVLGSASGSFAAAVAYSTAGSTYGQNFDTALAPTAVSGAVTEGSAGGGAWNDGTTVAGWNFYAEGATTQFNTTWASSGGSVTNQQNRPLTVGSAAAGQTNGITDRALGAQTVFGTTGTLALGTARGPIHYSVTLTNTSGATLNNFNLSYLAELWRVSNNEGADTDGLSVDYKIGLTPTDTNAAELANSTTGWSTIAGTAYTQTTTHTATAQQLDGNAPANATSKSGSVTGITWLAGQNLTVRWTDLDLDGNSNVINTLMAIDNVTFSATASSGTPEPAMLSVIGLGGLALVRRRRA